MFTNWESPIPRLPDNQPRPEYDPVAKANDELWQLEMDDATDWEVWDMQSGPSHGL